MTKKNKPFVLYNALKKVIGLTGLSRIFGLVRDIATTNLLGASIFHDIFVVVLKIPNLFRRFFAEGAFNQAFIPIYSDFEKENQKDATDEFLNSLAGILISSLFIFTILVLIFAPVFIFIFAPGFYLDPMKKDISINVLRIMFPYLALISLVAFAGGIQNSHKKFSIPAFNTVVFNICLIIAAILVAPMFEMPVYVLAWGVFLSGVLQLLIQILPLWRINRVPIPKLNINNPGLNKFFRLILPAILAGGIIQINLLIDTIFASFLATGSPTWLYVSDRLVQFPMGIFAIAIGTILLPTLSKYDLNFEREQFILSIQKGQRFVLFIGVPSLIGLFFCSEDLISTIFYRGAFTASDVINSSYSLMALSFGLPFFMLMKVLTPAFFARKDTKTPMYVALISLIINAVLNYYLAFILNYGHVGIAVGSSIAAIVSVCILEIVLYRDGFIKIKNIFNKFNLNIVISSLFVIVFLYFCTSKINFIEISQSERIVFLLIKVIVSIIIYFAISRLILKKPIRFLFD